MTERSGENVIVIEVSIKTLIAMVVVALILGFSLYYLHKLFSPPPPELKVGDVDVKPMGEALGGNVTHGGNVSQGVYGSYEVKSTVCLVAGGNPIVNEWVIVEVRDPEGRIVWVDQQRTNKEGCIVVHFGLLPSALEGKYTLYVSSKIAKVSKEFIVGGKE